VKNSTRTGELYVAGFTISSSYFFEAMTGRKNIPVMQLIRDAMKKVSSFWEAGKEEKKKEEKKSPPKVDDKKESKSKLSRISFGAGISLGIQSAQNQSNWTNPTDYSSGASLQEARTNATGVCSNEVTGDRVHEDGLFPYLRCSWNRFPSLIGNVPRISDYECPGNITDRVDNKCEVSAFHFEVPTMHLE
jgi:hypothetical protein